MCAISLTEATFWTTAIANAGYGNDSALPHLFRHQIITFLTRKGIIR